MSYQFGLTGDIPAVNATITNAITISRRTVANSMRTADLDGDGSADVSVFRPSTGTWFNLRSSTNYTLFATFQWGLSGDIPVSSDFDGDGATDVAVWRPSTGTWFFRESGTGFATSASFQWGLPGDIPVPGDYDGDGSTDLAVWRPSTGAWFIRLSSTDYTTSRRPSGAFPAMFPFPATMTETAQRISRCCGPRPGRWIRPAVQHGIRHVGELPVGLEGDITVPGDFDGDGKTDLGIYRPSSGTWFIRNSNTGYATSVDSSSASTVMCRSRLTATAMASRISRSSGRPTARGSS